jgi:AcrR family transcriptional regulator
VGVSGAVGRIALAFSDFARPGGGYSTAPRYSENIDPDELERLERERKALEKASRNRVQGAGLDLELQHAKVHRLILRAALRLFRETSFHDVGVEDIGAAAGVPTRAIYRHYRSKLDILIDAYERAGHRLGASLVGALEDAPTAAAAVDGLADRLALLAMRDLDLTVVTSRENRALPKDERPLRLRAFTALNSIWRQALAETRPELPAAEVGLLVDTVLPAIHTAAAQAEGHPERTPEIAALARAHLYS